MNWSGLAQAIRAATGIKIATDTAQPLGGGSINHAYRIGSSAGTLFIKCNTPARLGLFQSEVEGLEELAATETVNVPQVLACGSAAGLSYLVLDWLELQRGNSQAAAQLGRDLAALHSTAALQFGWKRDNYIGTTPQINTCCDDWAEFFIRNRLGYQLQLAAGSRFYEAGRRLLRKAPELLGALPVRPALLHGDLWGGNWASVDGKPFVFDPAVYYGDPETDLAMTELFGGFGAAFYSAYRSLRPEREGDRYRRRLYKLYHVINHYNLFGGGYALQASGLIEELLSA